MSSLTIPSTSNMIIGRIYPETRQSLFDFVHRYSDGAESVAIQAGHYLVYYDHTEDILLPCVREELKSPRHSVVMNSVGVFPFLTWKLALEMLGKLNCQRKGILTVVNDWQYVPKHVDRGRFYQDHARLFDSYKMELQQRNEVTLITQRDLGFKVKTGDWFSEVSIRNQYKRQISKLVKRNGLPAAAELAQNGDTHTCSLIDDVGTRHEIYCTGKRPSCTQEITELVRQICLEGEYQVFMNIYPLVCKEYVQAGTELCFEMNHLKSNIVVNIGIPSNSVSGISDLFANAETTVHANHTNTGRKRL